MATREIRLEGDAILSKECKIVKEMTDRLRELISDMLETMYAENGVGLAAPQVGILKQIFVVDIGDGNRFVCINPEITAIGTDTEIGEEGCLSVPGKQGRVSRALHINVRCKNENFEDVEFEAHDFLARAMQHEYDHLHGILYTSKVEGDLEDVVYEELEEDYEEYEDYEAEQ